MSNAPLEASVLFLRLGRVVASRGPGVIYVIPLLERLVRVTVRTVADEMLA